MADESTTTTEPVNPTKTTVFTAIVSRASLQASFEVRADNSVVMCPIVSFPMTDGTTETTDSVRVDTGLIFTAEEESALMASFQKMIAAAIASKGFTA